MLGLKVASSMFNVLSNRLSRSVKRKKEQDMSLIFMTDSSLVDTLRGAKNKR
jgi:hypothetical protein